MTVFNRTSTLLLAFCRMHEWLPAPSGWSYSPETFGAALKKAGVGRVALLRHGSTAKQTQGGVDFDRQLSDQGRAQAQEAGSSFGKELLPLHSKLFVSPAPRTVETAQIFLQAAGVKLDTIELIKDPILYDSAMQPAGSLLFRKIGYAPLKSYLDSENVEERQVAQDVMGAYAHDVTRVMADTLNDSSPNSSSSTPDATLLMVGHAIYLPAVALGIASLVGCEEVGKDMILSTNTVEAQGYLIDALDGSVTLLIRPSSNLA